MRCLSFFFEPISSIDLGYKYIHKPFCGDLNGKMICLCASQIISRDRKKNDVEKTKLFD